MGLDDKIQNTVDKVTGAAKEKIGDITDDEEKQTEGRVDQSKADRCRLGREGRLQALRRLHRRTPPSSDGGVPV
jgi:hypothetical protein